MYSRGLWVRCSQMLHESRKRLVCLVLGSSYTLCDREHNPANVTLLLLQERTAQTCTELAAFFMRWKTLWVFDCLLLSPDAGLDV